MLEFTAPGELRQGPRNAKQRVRDMQACDVWAAAATAFFVLTGQHLLQIPSDETPLQEQVFEEQKLLVNTPPFAVVIAHCATLRPMHLAT